MFQDWNQDFLLMGWTLFNTEPPLSYYFSTYKTQLKHGYPDKAWSCVLVM